VTRVVGHVSGKSGEASALRAALQIMIQVALLAGAAAGSGAACQAQATPELQNFFQQGVGLTEEQLGDLRNGQTVVKSLPPRTHREVFLIGVVNVHAAPEAYLAIARDFDRLRKLPNYVEIRAISNPAQLSDFQGLSFDSADMKDLKDCKPGNCQIQLPASSIAELQESIDWSAPEAPEQLNRLVQKNALDRMLAYQREGNAALGMYNDKRNPTEVPQQFAYMLSYYKALPEYLPDFYNYLLEYPDKKPSNVDDAFYWAEVKFGLKPTLRFVHLVTMHGNIAGTQGYAIAEKQLYSSHYFETALDLTFCVPDTDATKPTAFYLIKVLASEQSGLTGPEGSIVRHAAVGRSVSSLQKSLTSIKNTLEHNRYP